MKRSSRLSLALHALVHLLKQPDEALTSSALAECLMTNPVVVRRVLGELREAGIVASTKGHSGGWTLSRAAEQVSLRQIYEAMGERFLVRTESDPGDKQCAIVRSVDKVMGEFLSDAEALLAARLERVSLADIAGDVHAARLLHTQHGDHHHG